MEHLLTNITGLDMALCLAVLSLYLLRVPQLNDGGEGLDTGAVD